MTGGWGAASAPRTAIAEKLRSGLVFVRNLVTSILPVFFVGTVVTFLLTDLTGINPGYAKLGTAATPGAVAAFDKSWGLDRPLPIRYGIWLWHVLRGDFGTSWADGVPVLRLLVQTAEVTLGVALVALVIGVAVGFTLGSLAAVFRDSWFDRLVTLITTVTAAAPAFAFGMLLIAIFAQVLHLFPPSGYEPPGQGIGPWLDHLALPAAALSVDSIADIARQLRMGLVSERERPYVVGAMVRGLSRRRVFFVHTLRNAIAPSVAILGIKFSHLLGGAVVVEMIFGLPGYGSLVSSAALGADVPVVQGALIVSIVLVVAVNLLVNIIHRRLVPASVAGV